MKQFILSLLCLFFALNSYGEIGIVTKIQGIKDSFVLRNSQKIPLEENFILEKGDEIVSENSYVVILIHPATQLSLSKKTKMILSEATIEESGETSYVSSALELIKGMIRAQVIKDTNIQVDQKILTGNVSFAVRGTEFEVSNLDDDVDLDVIEGAVEVSSPEVHSFVPEIVKSNEGLKFKRKAARFERRKFALRFKDHPGFFGREKMRDIWRNKKTKLQRFFKRKERSEDRRFNRRKRNN